ncbi:ankyrin repeat domain-containing protein [Sodalis sp. RH14]|uniref:ankyrin repeat domain-containing protein n=1 Tax=Sodalis sp. RH14 TaxID=3394329 RepID=UPI0039B630BC
MQVITASVYYPPSASEHSALEQNHPMERITYTAEKYGSYENFEKSDAFKHYIKQTENDLIAIAELLECHDQFRTDIISFCEKLNHYENFSAESKRLLYINLNQCLHRFRQLNSNCFSIANVHIKDSFGDIFKSLKKNVGEVLTAILLADSAIDGFKAVSGHVYTRRCDIINAMLAQHVACHHQYFDDGKRKQYINAYKGHLTKANWLYQYLYKNNTVGKYILSETEPYFLPLLEQLNRAVDIVSVIKDIGNMIRHRIEKILNEPGHHLDIEGMRYFSERGHQAVEKFAQLSSPPVDLNTVLARNVDNNRPFLLKDADAIYGALAEALAAENNKEIVFHIKHVLIFGRIIVKSFNGFFWVEYESVFRGPLTLVALCSEKVQGVLDDDLLRFAIINTPSELLLNNFCLDWCGDRYSVLNDFMEENIFALYKWYFMNGKVNPLNKDKNGNTFLHAAVCHNDDNAYDYVKDKLDVIINCKNNFGVTALMQAVVKGETKMVLNLLDCEEIDIHIAEKNGFTALGLAVKNQRKDIEVILKSHSVAMNSRKWALGYASNQKSTAMNPRI